MPPGGICAPCSLHSVCRQGTDGRVRKGQALPRSLAVYRHHPAGTGVRCNDAYLSQDSVRLIGYDMGAFRSVNTRILTGKDRPTYKGLFCMSKLSTSAIEHKAYNTSHPRYIQSCSRAGHEKPGTPPVPVATPITVFASFATAVAASNHVARSELFAPPPEAPPPNPPPP